MGKAQRTSRTSLPDVSDSVRSELTKSFDGAAAIAAQYPQHANEIIAGAKASFLQGDQ